MKTIRISVPRYSVNYDIAVNQRTLVNAPFQVKFSAAVKGVQSYDVTLIDERGNTATTTRDIDLQ